MVMRKGMKVTAGVRAGGLNIQHSRGGMKIRSGVRAGGFNIQHNQKRLDV
jgi:hypothetical protein